MERTEKKVAEWEEDPTLPERQADQEGALMALGRDSLSTGLSK